jgi:uncharacterized protein (DUF302 family)
MTDSYTLTRTLDDPPAEAEHRVRAALSDQGFGVLSTIDVQRTLKDKLDHEMGGYTILGACNPPLAKQAIDADPDIGALLPCNVLLRENAAGGTDVVAADPAAMLSLSTDALSEVAQEARTRLLAALDALGADG